LNGAETTPIAWPSASGGTIDSVDGSIDFINWRKLAVAGKLLPGNQ